MNTEVDGMSPEFHCWQQLTDAYAAQLERLRHREPGASAELSRICRELDHYPTDFQDISDLIKLQRTALEQSRSHRTAANARH